MLKGWLSHYFHRQQLLAKQACTQRYIIIDLELTGLDPKQHEIVSIAWLMIEQQCIKLNAAQHKVNSDVKSLAQSPIFHGIAKQDIAQGQSLESILQELSHHFSDAILVFHNAVLDWGFLKLAFKAHAIKAQPSLLLDTFQIEKKRLHQQGHEIALNDLTLSECRKRYQLPHYSSHHALTDALATAELFLAQCHQISCGKKLKLGELI
ncbi:3'-5' exonuclease [Pseudoalteromonas mariniglutinosa]|uniref:3'-5' exonuclease n=1 Tax=Pseudoalteromonas mariniglutinosa TaxID=206042 RepID=UPI00384FD4C8